MSQRLHFDEIITKSSQMNAKLENEIEILKDLRLFLYKLNPIFVLFFFGFPACDTLWHILFDDVFDHFCNLFNSHFGCNF